MDTRYACARLSSIESALVSSSQSPAPPAIPTWIVKQFADALELDDEVIGGLVVGLGPLSLLAAALPSLPEPIGRTTLALMG
jgi:hypothetical protein